MPSARSRLNLAFYLLPSNPGFERLHRENVLERVRRVDAQAREEGLASLKASSDNLIRIGMEVNGSGSVTKNGFGVLNLPWQVEQHPEWADTIRQEVLEIRAAIRRDHGVRLRYLIWAGMGGSAEDKAFYQAAGLLGKRVRVYILDSTDPAKLRAILDHIEASEKRPLKEALRKTLVVGMAMGMTSYEPVLNLEVLDALYRKLRAPNQSNFIYMTLPGSILDRFGRRRGFRRVELQLDNDNTTAGRHSGPLTRGTLYPLELAGCDLSSWMRAAMLNEDEISAAFELAGFLHANALVGRDKVTLFLPREWLGGAVWTKQDFEESLGKSEDIGIKVAIGEKIRPLNYFPPKESAQDRCFLVVNARGLQNPDAAKVSRLRRAGYPVAVLRVHGESQPARYMQFIHYTVFGLGYLRDMNFVTQPNVELYKTIAGEIHSDAGKVGGTVSTKAWGAAVDGPCSIRWRGGLTVHLGSLRRLDAVSDEHLRCENGNAAAIYAAVLRSLVEKGKVSYGELTFFGDTRYHSPGKALLRTLSQAAEGIFRSRLKMPADVYEGPAMNHSYHEMIIGYGRGFSTVLLSEKPATFKKVDYAEDYHRAQWLATQEALTRRGRAVAGITIRDLSERSRQNVKEFFSEVARRVKRRRS